MKMAIIKRLLMRPHSETTIYYKFLEILSHTEHWTETRCVAALWTGCTSLFAGENERMEEIGHLTLLNIKYCNVFENYVPWSHTARKSISVWCGHTANTIL